MTLSFYSTILFLCIRECNEVTWQVMILAVQLVQDMVKKVPGTPDLQPRGLGEPEVPVDVVWVLVLKEAGLASLCLQRPLEIILTVTLRAALHSCPSSGAKRGLKRVAGAGAAGWAVPRDHPCSAR